MPSVMHVELGGSYGGSLRALELYLQYCDRARLQHHLLLVQPVEGPVESMERLRPLVSSLRILTPGFAPGGRGRALPRPSALRRLEPWLLLAARAPQARRLAKIFRASGCSLIHCNNTFTCQASTLLAARWAGLPLIAHVRNPVGGGAAGPRRYERWLAQQAQRFIALHAGQEEQLRGLGVRGEIFRCGDGIELPPAGAGRVAALRRQFVPEGGLLLGSLGRLEEQKGYDALIEAAAGVLPHHPRARLVIFGEGGERQRLRGAIARLGLEGRVLLPGFTSDRASALAALDLFVCSSRWEGVPLSVLEAMLAGKPVVATQAALAGEPRLLRWLAAPAAGPGAESLAAALAAAMTAAMTCALQQGYGAGNCRDARAWVEQEFAPAAAARHLDAALAAAAGTEVRREVRTFYESAYRQARWQPAALATASGSRFTKMWYRAVERHVLPRLELDGRRVLEIGCGYGWLAPRLEAAGASYVGLDVAESALRQLPRLPAIAPVLGDACRLPFADGHFDVVFCMEVLEHVPDRRRLLAEIVRVAAPGASVVLTTPNYANCFLPLKLLASCGSRACRRYLTDQPVDHLQFAFALRRLVERHGAIVEQRAIRLHPPLAERLDQRFGPGRGPARFNDWLFAFEHRWGASFPWRHCGLHTCFVLRTRPGMCTTSARRCAAAGSKCKQTPAAPCVQAKR